VPPTTTHASPRLWAARQDTCSAGFASYDGALFASRDSGLERHMVRRSGMSVCAYDLDRLQVLREN